jgi:hypothetical protein
MRQGTNRGDRWVGRRREERARVPVPLSLMDKEDFGKLREEGRERRVEEEREEE